ncbi:MAG: hypothetical protein OXC31_10615 [Spirochaetaceae bacterium]|nr:hypothetical protein [Spirochaetaceae bacterium]
MRFILCGSSAGKLKRRANVLGRPRAAPVVSTEPVEREVGGIRIVPWESFLSRLRAVEIIAYRLSCDPQA